MIPSIKTILIATVTLVTMDLLWIGYFMASFYQTRLQPILNFVDGKLEPRIIPVIITYITMILLVCCVAVPLARTFASGSLLHTFAIGAFLGLIVYGLYNFTNLSLLRDWNTTLAIVDTLWGGVIVGVATLLVFFFV